MSRTYSRAILISIFIVAISFFNYTNLEGRECIRAIHVVTLLVAGMGIGIFIMNLFKWLRSRRE